MVSEKQQIANENNAISGGVKTPEGKEISKYNSQKHGILRQAITEYEDSFYNDFSERLDDELQPKGVIEEILTERIAICYLKLSRITKAEKEYMKSVLNPRITETKDLFDVKLTEIIIKNEGYTPQVGDKPVDTMLNVYARYETTVENRLYKAIHELERIKKARNRELNQSVSSS